jgi:hypothetical protein
MSIVVRLVVIGGQNTESQRNGFVAVYLQHVRDVSTVWWHRRDTGRHGQGAIMSWESDHRNPFWTWAEPYGPVL